MARHYLYRALIEAQGNRTLAADLLVLPSYQRLSSDGMGFAEGEEY